MAESRFLGPGNMIAKNEQVRGRTTRKPTGRKPRKVHGGSEYTDHVWTYSAIAGGMVMKGVYDAAPTRSLEPIADSRVAVPDMNTRHARMVTRKASATPSLANVVGKPRKLPAYFVGEW